MADASSSTTVKPDTGYLARPNCAYSTVGAQGSWINDNVPWPTSLVYRAVQFQATFRRETLSPNADDQKI